MHPLYIIARREFLQRVRQKSFWIMLLLGPFFLMLVMVVPIGLAMEKSNSSEILYLDQSSELENYFYSEPGFALVKVDGSLEECLKKVASGGYSGLIHLQKMSSVWEVKFYQVGMSGENTSFINSIIKSRITEYELSDQPNVSLPKIDFKIASTTEFDKGKPDNTIGFVIGLFAAVLILIFINQYSHMVLRGVVEEKQNRISELILTSIKPLYFISGKITGIASVAFLQILVWVTLSGLVTVSVQHYFKLDRFSDQNLSNTLKLAHDVPQTLEMNSLLNAISSINGTLLIVGFIFYFVVGYLLFSTMFAILGISVGNDTDAQQLAVPFTLPLLLPVILLQYITEHQNSGFTLFLTLFPLTSPSTMLLRLPLGVPMWQMILSGGILITTLLAAAYIAAKTYRFGIFMYGKKLSFHEIWNIAKQT